MASHHVAYEFGEFQLDRDERVLRRGTATVPLTPKATEILLALIDERGHIVEKADLMRQVWADTAVEEGNLTQNIYTLRRVLSDTDGKCPFIETVPRRGYRFVGSVRIVQASPVQFIAPINSNISPTPDLKVNEAAGHGEMKASLWSRRPVASFVLGLAAISGVVAAAFPWTARRQGTPPAMTESAPVRLTSNPADVSVTSAHISRDGRHLAFGDRTGLQVRSIDSGRVHRFPDTEGMDVYGWTPDSAGILASRCGDVSCVGWVISLVGQDRHRTGAVWSRDERVLASPDGQRLLRFTFAPAKKTLAVDPMNGSPTQIVATGDIVGPTWSVDGRRVLFVRFSANTIESVPAEGGRPLEVFRGPWNTLIRGAIELPDRTILISMFPPGSLPGTSGESELWRAHPDPAGVVREAPRRLTWSAANATSLTVSSNGRAAYLNTRFQLDAYVADGDLRHGSVDVPRRFTLSDSDNLAYSWTPDSSAILLSSNRHGTWDIFKQPFDSDIAEPFRGGARNQRYPGVTNDGRWVLYADGSGTGADDNIMRVSLSGGAVAEVASQVGNGRVQCAQHGRCVLIQEKDKSYVISSLHPLEGKGRELARIPVTSGFRLLPDGDSFAYILPTENGIANRVRLISFTGKPDTDIVVKDAVALTGLGWLPSNAGFLSTDRGKLLLGLPDGTSKVLWAPTGLSSIQWAVPSPDERHVVINVMTRHTNAWMVSGF